MGTTGGVVTASVFSSSYQRRRFGVIPTRVDLPTFSSNNHLTSELFQKKFRKLSFRCNNSSTGGDSGENESRTILDAFFLGKAVAEAVNERIESAVGEFLSTVGRLQAEQQKQVQEFQEEVLEKARRAKEQAARETMEPQGLVSKSATPMVEVSPAVNGVASQGSSSETKQPTNNEDEPPSGIPIED